MSFNENRRNDRKNAEKSRGCTSKITHIFVVLKMLYSAKFDFKLMLRHSMFTTMIQLITH